MIFLKQKKLLTINFLMYLLFWREHFFTPDWLAYLIVIPCMAFIQTELTVYFFPLLFKEGGKKCE